MREKYFKKEIERVKNLIKQTESERLKASLTNHIVWLEEKMKEVA